MDLVTSCKEKLANFRMKELKDVLAQMGLSRQGRKQDLVQRILTILSDEPAGRLWSKRDPSARERVAKLVEDGYRKMQASWASEVTSKGQVSSDISNVKVKGQPEDIKVRCICGSSLVTESMIQCEDPRCHVWEHVGCVIIPEKPMEVNQSLPEPFYCAICRLTRADPFWVTMAHPLYPVRLTSTIIPTDGLIPMPSVDRTFRITRADKDLLVKHEYDVQAWCMLLNDKVIFRMQWPQYADLQVNGVHVRAIDRPRSQLLGANGRDDGPIITHCVREGINKISLSRCDSRIFCLGVRLVKRRTLQQVLNMIPDEDKGEPFENALSRVRRCIGGATGNDDADGDSDIEVVADFFDVNLRCPMSGSRMKVAGRFKPCVHMGCFDLEVFVELNQRSREWQCPICLKNYCLEHIIVDPYFNRITSMMRHCDDELADIEIKPDGSWRVKLESDSKRRKMGELPPWRLPNGSLIPTVDEMKPKMEILKPVEQEGCSDGPTPLKLGIRKNCNGNCEVSKPNTSGLSSSNREDKVEYQEQNVIPMSSSSTGSGRDSDDHSVNQDALGTFELGNNGMELGSLSTNVNPSYNVSDKNHQAAVASNNEPIVLSDSDEENDVAINGINSYSKDPTMAGGSSGFDHFTKLCENYDMPKWQFSSETQGGPGFQLFASHADVSEGLVSLEPGPSNRAPAVSSGYTIAQKTSMPSIPMFSESVGRREANTNNGSLQIFLPTRPDNSAQSDLGNQAEMSNGTPSDDWISLRLGNQGETIGVNKVNENNPASTREGALDTLSETASLLVGINEGSKQEKASRQRSDSPFSFPRKKRSVRPRLFLTTDSDSE
ncbi:PREDICTED: E3 SUMO-protein ligase SIZ1-like [Camelina sativa]|uniref:E3 SUMO-protein ligase SIZ1-like n=1 Tax=Camelina sativa TaxID=90675 RepID=A0ABM0TG88_CAMSA|nr:PREDICTED: E3 SUMO-protein ligase SIZ1-like [Camelina sativa]